MEAEVSDYTTCKSCGKRHSTLVRHKCFKAKKQDERPDLKPDEPGDGGDDEGTPGSESAPEGDGDSQGDSQGEGKDEGEGEADGDGNEEGDGSEGEGEEEGEAEGEAEAPAPQMPEDDIPPVAIVCSVLKYAALCAQCAKNGVMSIELIEDGLFIYGANGPITATGIIPWAEIEARATTDGQFYVKEVIDGLDQRLGVTPPRVDVEAMIAQYKPDEAELPKVPTLTLPLFEGQRVVNGLGVTGVVGQPYPRQKGEEEEPARIIRWDNGNAFWHRVSDGKFGRVDFDEPSDHDPVRDDDGSPSKVRLNWPRTNAEGYSCGRPDGWVGVWNFSGVHGEEQKLKFPNGVPASVYRDHGDGIFTVGIQNGKGTFAEHRLKKLCGRLGNGTDYQIEVDEFGYAVKDPTVQIVVNQ